MMLPYSEQELSDLIFDRIIVHCPKCPETECLRIACQKVAAELLAEAEVLYRKEPVADGGA